MKIAAREKREFLFLSNSLFYDLLLPALVGVVGNEQGTGTGTSAASNIFAQRGIAVSLKMREKQRERETEEGGEMLINLPLK